MREEEEEEEEEEDDDDDDDDDDDELEEEERLFLVGFSLIAEPLHPNLVSHLYKTFRRTRSLLREGV